ncbi:RNA-binding cell elongation regulator Jag/EloR [Levilinea saccharolytica]|uniref:RNA-binding protein KhpB n=1 Tax=Levilinea saccharolytica TaxID=229921 RepID=A0A0P6XIZ8_9CHLR|nr:RNA-binding cell elongation regulator Jag/EloR [Levilinea saccharolytica]KPL75572.1 hypothetical protein ADN01_17060 [Levilinea saccharolytica]GAP17035.1 predicted RNA-binding protein [Levilinea saccharolytica]
MSEEKTTLEVIAPTVDEAIANGLGQLGLPREMVDVEVLDAGSRGLFGLGGRQARVRLSIRWAEEGQSKSSPAAPPVESPAPKNEEAPAVTTAPVPAPARTEPAGDEETLRIAVQVVSDLLERMKVRARVTADYVQPEEGGDQPTVMVEIQGNDLSILIGRRSETLNALQYIANLIVGREAGRWVPLMIDVQGYRQRRERQLRQLARRMAEQALHTGRRQVLEPMPANERRVIHLELREHDAVSTESVGEEPNRKVTIVPKK